MMMKGRAMSIVSMFLGNWNGMYLWDLLGNPGYRGGIFTNRRAYGVGRHLSMRTGLNR